MGKDNDTILEGSLKAVIATTETFQASLGEVDSGGVLMCRERVVETATEKLEL